MFFHSYKEHLIAVGVLCHFLLGGMAVIPPRSYIYDIPGIRQAIEFYQSQRFEQSWPMFSPPPRDSAGLSYAVKFERGWSELLSLQEPVIQQLRSNFIQPRGAFRVATHLRIDSKKDIFQRLLNSKDQRAFYYQQLVDYYCHGDGKIKGAQKIRLYVEIKGLPNFFQKDDNGDVYPPPEEYNRRFPIYEEACDHVQG